MDGHRCFVPLHVDLNKIINMRIEFQFFPVFLQKSKPVAGPQRFVELFVVVDNAEVKKKSLF